MDDVAVPEDVDAVFHAMDPIPSEVLCNEGDDPHIPLRTQFKNGDVIDEPVVAHDGYGQPEHFFDNVSCAGAEAGDHVCAAIDAYAHAPGRECLDADEQEEDGDGVEEGLGVGLHTVKIGNWQ